MRIIRNKYIPFSGYKAINLFGVLFVKGNAYISDVDIIHESIHSAQMKELLYIGFYLLYLVEWLWKLCKYGDSKMAYYDISFEKEAYSNENDPEYIDNRTHYAMWKNC